MHQQLQSKILTCTFLYFMFTSIDVKAHPMPNTIIHLDCQKTHIGMTLKMPLSDFQIAFAQNNNGFIDLTSDKLQAYFLQHIKVENEDSSLWQPQFISFDISETQDSMVGKYQELLVTLNILPPELPYHHVLILHYDAIIHQIPNHEAMVFIDEETTPTGTIKLDIPNGIVPNLLIIIEKSRMSNFINYNMIKTVPFASLLFGAIVIVGIINSFLTKKNN
jgi:hypothetical protein